MTSTDLAPVRADVPVGSAGTGAHPADGSDSPLADPAERELVDRARNGNAEAFAELITEHQRAIHRLAMRVLHCDPAAAEDVCQDVFLRAWRGLQRFDGEIRFAVWLHKIAMNACISQYRKARTLKRGSHRTISLDATATTGAGAGGDEGPALDLEGREVDPMRRASDHEFVLRVRQAVTDLPEDFRDAVVLRDVQGLSYEEVSEVLGVPVGTVRSRIHRGRLQLQDMLRGFES